MPLFDTKQEDRLWDVAVLGAGTGGSFMARALAEAGHDVLLVEYGNRDLSSPDAPLHSDVHERRLAENRWPTKNTFEIDGVARQLFGEIGSGIGGSSNLYAAALERFDKPDIDLHPEVQHPTGGWPISYNEMLPYYEEAERLLHVLGTRDPLGVEKGIHVQSPPPLGPCDAHFAQFFESQGLHPYRLHVGIRYRSGCDECLGRLCRKDCRSDARSVLAEADHKPTVLSRTEVVRIEATRDRVTHAILSRDKQQIKLRAKIFVLAAGAIHTPKLLLRSVNQHWPEGLANCSGLVGRNLMFHAAQNFALWPKKRLPTTGPRKCLAFRDFYHVGTQRLGTVQSTGFAINYGELLMHLYNRFDHGRLRKLRFLRHFLRVPAFLATALLGPGTLFTCIIEDMPYPENRIILDSSQPDGILIRYTIKEELRERTNHLRRLLEERMKNRRFLYLSRQVELNFGHPCGTCVMSKDPETGVVDPDCRAHGIENLFIADASFMPTSAASNPALTVAANALRVADKISPMLSRELVAETLIQQ